MKFYSTKSKRNTVDLREAVLKSLPSDNGLYMPQEIPSFPKGFIDSLDSKSFQEIAYVMATPFLEEDFSSSVIQDIIDHAVNFDAPLVTLDDNTYSLELWHGPSLAFKDFGARFMAATMGRLVEQSDKKLTILVATSGDTGGAVAAGFLGVENVDVFILYPKGKVSVLQEKQLTTLGQNITAIEVDGTFDDCQALVKKAFLDSEFIETYNLSSANSINIARLIPQSFYYTESYKQIVDKSEHIAYSVPSGNFGNLTAGVFAKKMGLPIDRFLAATNSNDVVPHYLHSGQFTPKRSVHTISNAMDVGNPSNFQRLSELYSEDWNLMKQDISGFSFTDDQTRSTIAHVKERYGYVMEPHGAIGYLALRSYRHDTKCTGVVLETAHPAKFLPVIEPILGEVEIPERLDKLKDAEKVAHQLGNSFADFKSLMIG
jgi:threonine synthase